MGCDVFDRRTGNEPNEICLEVFYETVSFRWEMQPLCLVNNCPSPVVCVKWKVGVEISTLDKRLFRNYRTVRFVQFTNMSRVYCPPIFKKSSTLVPFRVRL